MPSITDRSGNEIVLQDSVLEVSDEDVVRINAASIPTAMMLVRGKQVLVPSIHYTVSGTEITFTPPVHYTEIHHAVDLDTGNLAWSFDPVA